MPGLHAMGGREWGFCTASLDRMTDLHKSRRSTLAIVLGIIFGVVLGLTIYAALFFGPLIRSPFTTLWIVPSFALVGGVMGWLYAWSMRH